MLNRDPSGKFVPVVIGGVLVLSAVEVAFLFTIGAISLAAIQACANQGHCQPILDASAIHRGTTAITNDASRGVDVIQDVLFQGGHGYVWDDGSPVWHTGGYQPPVPPGLGGFDQQQPSKAGAGLPGISGEKQACPPATFPLETPSGPYTSGAWHPPIQLPHVLMARPGYTGPPEGYRNLGSFRRVQELYLEDVLSSKAYLEAIERSGRKVANYIYVIDQEGRIRVHVDDNIVHHSYLVDKGENVYGAGHMHIDDTGRITVINDVSCHYFRFRGGGSQFFEYMKYILQKQGIDPSKIIFYEPMKK